MGNYRVQDVPFLLGRRNGKGNGRARNPYPDGSEDAARWNAGAGRVNGQCGPEPAPAPAPVADVFEGQRVPNQYWTDGELRDLRACYGFRTMDAIRSLLPQRSVAAIENKAYEIGLTERDKPHRKIATSWTDKEDDILKRYYANMTAVDLEKLLPGRTAKAIGQRASLLDLPQKRRGRQYQDEVEAAAAIKQVVIKEPDTDPDEPRQKVFWTPEEDRALSALAALGKTAGEIAETLNRAKTSIVSRSKILKIDIPTARVPYRLSRRAVLNRRDQSHGR